jgi:hypothetical protein
MGRHLKNDRLRTAGSGSVMPYGPTSLRPVTPVPGDFRFNTDTNLVEVYYSGQWNTLTREGPVTIIKDTFTGDNFTTTFTMSKSYSPGDETKVIAVVGNIFQNPAVAFTFPGPGSSTQIVFTSAPPFGQTVIVLHGFASTVAA